MKSVIKRQEAEARVAAFQAMSLPERLAVVCSRRGNSAKEVKKLSAAIQKAQS